MESRPALSIIHDKDSKRFYCVIDGNTCLLDYSTVNINTINIYHTYVPPVLRGQGIAHELVLEAARFARASRLLIIPGCSYAAAVLERNKEFCSVLSPEWLESGSAPSCSLGPK